MKLNDGTKLVSRGLENVWIYGEWKNKTVYCIPNQWWKFYIKLNGEFIEVFHKANYFSTQE